MKRAHDKPVPRALPRDVHKPCQTAAQIIAAARSDWLFDRNHNGWDVE